MSNMVFILVLLPLAGAVVVLLCGKARPRWAYRAAAGCVIATVAAALWTAVAFDPQAEPIPAASLSLFSPAAWQVDGINVWLLVLTALLAHAAVLITNPHASPRIDLFLALVLLLEASLMGLFAAGNLLALFLCWEVSRVVLFFLTGSWGGTDRRQAAMKFFLFTLVGSGLTFVGCGVLVLSHHWMSGGADFTLNLPQLIDELPRLAVASPENARYWAGVQPWLFAAIGLGFAIHVPLFPLHIWLQDVAIESSTAGMVLLCGGWVKIGLFGWLRLLLPLFPEWCHAYAGFFLWPAAIGTVYGVMLALVQDDLKRLAANLTVSCVSLTVLGLFSLNAAGINGSLLSVCSHGLSIGILICVAGALFERYRTREAEAFGGLTSRFPRLAVVTFAAVASLAMLPLTSGFAASILVLLGVARVHPGFLITALVAIVLCAWCFARIIQRIFWGRFREPVIDHPSWKPKHEIDHAARGDLNGRELAAVVPLIVAVFCLGLMPQVFVAKVEPAAARLVELCNTPAEPSPLVRDDESDR